jgi:PmbA protein
MDETLLNDLLDAARAAGADAAEAAYAERQSLSITVRTGALEEVEREEARDLGLRVFVGQRHASISGSDISRAGRERLVERVVAMARLAPEDPYASLAPRDRLAEGPYPDLDLYDPQEPDPESLEAQAREAEEAARSVEGVTNSDGGSATWSSSRWMLATSHGFAGVKSDSGYGLSASVLSGDGDAKERDYDWRSARHLADLDSPSNIGTRAGARAVKRLNPGTVKSGQMPVVFDPRVGGSFVGHLLGGISGSAIARKTSFLLESLGAQLFEMFEIGFRSALFIAGGGVWPALGVAKENGGITFDGVFFRNLFIFRNFLYMLTSNIQNLTLHRINPNSITIL